MSEPVRVAVVGLGEFGLLHLEAYLRNPQCEVVAVVGRDASKTEAIAARYGIVRWFTSTLEMMEALAPAAVSVVTAGAHHLEPTAQALAAGASVLLEKPVALSVDDAEQLRRMAESATGFVMPAHVLRFADPYKEVKRRIESGRLGTVLSMAFRRHRPRDHDARFPDVHPVFMTAIHDIDLAIWFSGAEVCDVTSWQVDAEGSNQPAVVWVAVRASDGSMWSFQVSWLLPDDAENDDTVEIFGSQGTLSLGRDMLLRELVVDAPVDEVDFSGFELEDALAAELDYFIDCVRTGRAPQVISLAEAIQGIALAGQVVAGSRARPV